MAAYFNMKTVQSQNRLESKMIVSIFCVHFTVAGCSDLPKKTNWNEKRRNWQKRVAQLQANWARWAGAGADTIFSLLLFFFRLWIYMLAPAIKMLTFLPNAYIQKQ